MAPAQKLGRNLPHVREQKYKLWPTISNGHRSISYKKVSVPIPGQIKIKGATLTVRVYGEIKGGNRCHRCGGEGHFKADCPRQQDDGDARQTVAPPAARATPPTTTTTTTTTTTKTVAAPVARPNEPTTGASPKQQQQQPTTTSTRPGTPYPAPSNSKSPQQSPRRERVVRRRLLPEDDPTTNATNNNNSICSYLSSSLQIDLGEEGNTNTKQAVEPATRGVGVPTSSSTPNKRVGNMTPSSLEQEVANNVKRLREYDDKNMGLSLSDDTEGEGEESEDSGANGSPRPKSSNSSLYSEIVSISRSQHAHNRTQGLNNSTHKKSSVL